MRSMTIHLDHTIVPAKDKTAAAQFFAEIFGLKVKPGRGYFAQVQVNESLTLDFADETEPWRSHHYAFHISEAEFEDIWSRVKAKQLPHGSGPAEHTNGRTYTRRGGRGVYFEDPARHPLHGMTGPGTGGARVLLRGPRRTPARSHDGSGDGELADRPYSLGLLLWLLARYYVWH